MAESLKKHRVPLLLAAVLALLWACYWQTATHSFFWDTNHIFSTEAVRSLSAENLYWLLTNTVIANWHPLTLATHAFDYSLYGSDPAGHHLVNVAIHCGVTVAIFYCVRQLAGLRADADAAFCIAAMTTILFALHPLRVESVAWVAARKDLLYSLFYVLAVMSYVAYVKAAGAARPRFYLLAVVLFSLSLLSKSMAVTLPAVLVLLDCFPLARLDIRRPLAYLRCEFLDKLPFIGLSCVIVVVTLVTQSDAMASRMDVADQLRNMTHNIVFYIERLLAPVGLVPFYPFPGPDQFYSLSYWLPQLLLAGGVTIAAAILALRGQTLVLVCWLAYLAMLAPASGVIHVGSAVAADRYTYISQLPLLVLLAVASLGLWNRFGQLRRAMVITALLCLVTLTSLTYMQVRHWQNPITLWSHVLRIYPDASLAHRNLGTAYFNAGDFDGALVHIDYLALQGWPVASLLIETLQASGRTEEGLARYRALLDQSGLSSQQQKTFAEIVRLLTQEEEVPDVGPG